MIFISIILRFLLLSIASKHPLGWKKKNDKLEVWTILSSKKSRPRCLSFLYKSILIIIHIIGQKNVGGKSIWPKNHLIKIIEQA